MKNLPTDWQEKPISIEVETTSHPITEVEFPTVTICPQDPDPNKWTLVMKALNQLDLHCQDNMYVLLCFFRKKSCYLTNL